MDRYISRLAQQPNQPNLPVRPNPVPEDPGPDVFPQPDPMPDPMPDNWPIPAQDPSSPQPGTITPPIRGMAWAACLPNVRLH